MAVLRNPYTGDDPDPEEPGPNDCLECGERVDKCECQLEAVHAELKELLLSLREAAGLHNLPYGPVLVEALETLGERVANAKQLTEEMIRLLKPEDAHASA